MSLRESLAHLSMAKSKTSGLETLLTTMEIPGYLTVKNLEIAAEEAGGILELINDAILARRDESWRR